MGSDATGLDEQAGAPRGASSITGSTTMDIAAISDTDIGYEAADPSLHAPGWDEAGRSDAATRGRR